jgi:hypothetical protein
VHFFFFCLFFFLYHTAFKLSSLWHVGYLLGDFYDFYVCSCTNLLMYNSARCPDSIEPPQLLGSTPSYFPFADVVVLHPLPHSPSSSTISLFVTISI